jgi:hypothetical protein
MNDPTAPRRRRRLPRLLARTHRIDAFLADSVGPLRNLVTAELGTSLSSFMATVLETHPSLSAAVERATGIAHPEAALRPPPRNGEDERRAHGDWVASHVAAVSLASSLLGDRRLSPATRAELRAQLACDVMVSGPGYRALSLLKAPAPRPETDVFTARSALQRYAGAILAAILLAVVSAEVAPLPSSAQSVRHASAQAHALVRAALDRLSAVERREVLAHYGSGELGVYLLRALDDAAALRRGPVIQAALERFGAALRELAAE